MWWLLVATSIPSTAPTLVAITADLKVTDANSLVHVNVETAQITNVATPFASWNTNAAAFDSDRDVLYIATRRNSTAKSLSVIGYNSSSGNVISDVELKDRAVSSLYALNYENDLAQILCIVWITGRAPQQIAVNTLDAGNGSLTQVATLSSLVPDTQLYSFEISASGYDRRTKTMYQMLMAAADAKVAPPGGGHILWRVDVQAPDKSSLIVLPSLSQYDLLASTLYWNGHLHGVLENATVARIDVDTGKVDLLASRRVFPLIQSLQMPFHAALVEERMLFTVAPMVPRATYPQGSTLVSVSLRDGTAHQTPITAPLMMAHMLR